MKMKEDMNIISIFFGKIILQLDAVSAALSP